MCELNANGSKDGNGYVCVCKSETGSVLAISFPKSLI